MVRVMTHFLNFCASHVFVIGEAGHFKLRLMIDAESTSACMIYYSSKGCVQSHMNSLNFG